MGEENAAAGAAAGGRRRRSTQVKKHRAMRSAASEQCDNVSEGKRSGFFIKTDRAFANLILYYKGL